MATTSLWRHMLKLSLKRKLICLLGGTGPPTRLNLVNVSMQHRVSMPGLYHGDEKEPASIVPGPRY